MELFRFRMFYINILALNTFKIRLIFILFLFGAFFSCSDFNQKEQLRKVDKLTNSLDSLSLSLAQHIPDSLNSMRQTMLNTEIALKNKVIMDTIDVKYAKDMDTYKLARKRIGKINHHLVEQRSAIKKEKKQLASLKNDIEKGWGKRNQYDAYIKLENKNIAVLATKSREIQSEVVNVCEIYRMLHPKMKTLLAM